jgi:serine-type D-Ala-D-Ala carboxypeptidase (penicillin-binding protein 5/6)
MILTMRLLAAFMIGALAFGAMAAKKPAPATEAAPAQTLASPPPAGALGIAAKSYLLLDVQSDQVLTGQSADVRVEPASLTKLMTAYLVFDALKRQKLSLTQALPVSERAWKAEGSRMFIDPKTPVTVEELLHGMITQSGNDASIALAEAVGGSEEAFAELMNKQAQTLGLKSTHFKNATGLPHAEHYSTAMDMGRLAAAVIRDFPDRYPLYAIKEYRYNSITQLNRNRLLWIDPTVDGVKTGHTDNAGFCLVASAKRGERRLLSVVLGTASESARAVESQKLLNHGFQAFDTRRLFKKDDALASLPVYKGAAEVVPVGFERDLYFSLPRQDFDRLKSNLTSQQPLLAPLTKGQPVGALKLTLDDKVVAEYQVVAVRAVEPAGFFGRMWDSVRLMLK